MDKTNVVIFGAGNNGLCYYNMIKDKYNVVAFADNNNTIWGEHIFKIPIIAPEEIAAYTFDIIEVTVEKYYKEIVFQLVNLGFEERQISHKWLDQLYRKKEIERNYEFVSGLSSYFEKWKVEEYEKRWLSIKKRYRQVKVYRIVIDAIGECITRIIPFLYEEEKQENVLKVVLPDIPYDNGRLCNKELIKLFNRKVYIPMGEDILFWRYVIDNHEKELDLSDLDKYKYRNPYPTYPCKAYERLYDFSKEQIDYGEARMKEIGIRRPYVCFAARTNRYNYKTLNNAKDLEDEYVYRNMDFNDYYILIQRLYAQGVQSVRMGRYEDAVEPIEDLIDYASKYEDDFMDLYIIANAKCMISNDSGITTIASLFGVPLLTVNVMPFSFGAGGGRYTEFDMFAPKIYKEKRTGRVLSLLQMANVEQYCMIWNSKYSEQDIDYCSLTPEAIGDIGDDFFRRIDGNTTLNKADMIKQNNVSEVLEIIKKVTDTNDKNWTGTIYPGILSQKYINIIEELGASLV